MADKYLYDLLMEYFGSLHVGEIRLPKSITDNLNPKYQLRRYQVDGLQRFICYFENEFEFKMHPSHLLFNMATGSGKTLIMAGLIPYLYEKGYRNFLFFVHNKNILEKTKDNFLNPVSIKYLFNREINIDNKRVRVSPVENFEAANAADINICFTTIQQLHIDITTEKENELTLEDFRKHKVVLIADEAHHMNRQTKAQRELFDCWENTVEGIFKQNYDNLLLEFTATHDYETPAMAEKYRNKVLIRYDLIEFRNDGYSKDVVIVKSDFGLRERILQALIVNQYKQEVAAKYRINLKPVLLFKAQSTIAQSKDTKKLFHEIIDALSAKDITAIRKSDIPLVQRGFHFFDENGIGDAQLVERLKRGFQKNYCISVNEEAEKNNYQILLNTLEDKNNRLRAIFAVHKLSEGWDVLNLFDIVRCYETRDSGRSKIGFTTISEAQLIGRGARYFPFVLPDNDIRFRRKFDEDVGNELRVLEELHYHSINDSRYIAEIRRALIEQGIMDEKEVTRKIELKDSFKKTPFYKYGVIWLNERRPKDYRHIDSLSDLGVKKRNFVHSIVTGHGGATVALERNNLAPAVKNESQRDVKVSDIERNIIRSAIARVPFFTFVSLKRYFPNLNSILEFASSEKYLSGLEITFTSDLSLTEIERPEKLSAMLGLLGQVENEIRGLVTDFEGTHDFHSSPLREVFKDKELKFDSGNPRAKEDRDFEQFVSTKNWFVFNTLYGTSEEKPFVKLLDRFMASIQEKYTAIYLIRNEGHFKIYNFPDGQAFQPDFVLFAKEKTGRLLTYQIFIEPKGKYLQEHDRWKEGFLEEIKKEFSDSVLKFDDEYKYRLIGVPFYNTEDENEFKETLKSVLDV